MFNASVIEMKTKVNLLSNQEFTRKIEEAVQSALNEITGKQLSVIPNVAIDAVNNIQNGNNTKQINKTKSVSYDSQITKADDLYPKVVEWFLKKYNDTPILFFAYTRLGNPVHFVFKVQNIRKLIDDKAILSGEISFRKKVFIGDIVIDFSKNKIAYKDRFDKLQYSLEPDKRSVDKLNDLLKELKSSLLNRTERGLKQNKTTNESL